MSAAAAGTVYLVGAGPGDPGLLTLRGGELLAACDAVVVDALANPELLRHCRADVQRFDVGKRAGEHSATQSEINTLLVRLARSVTWWPAVWVLRERCCCGDCVPGRRGARRSRAADAAGS
ncbi:MAG TPA: SAM-dependent methyltransferase [Candidatus Angelobacter sp.]|nr:SAM-dependent methyltransferase [Candidatus Angelobacter sp.]